MFTLSKQTIGKMILCACILVLWGTQSVWSAEPTNRRDVRRDNRPPSAQRYAEGTCGEEWVFDRNSGRMVRNKRIDLVVTKVEMRRDERGVAVKPTIKNRCPDSTGRTFDIQIAEVVTGFGPLAGNTSHTLGHWILVSDATSIRVKADYRNKIKNEVSEFNNVCTASFPRSMTSKDANCR